MRISMKCVIIYAVLYLYLIVPYIFQLENV